MTEGLKFIVPTQELQGLLNDRAAYHRERAEEKQRELPSLREALQKVSEAGNRGGRGPGGSNVSNKTSTSYAFDADDPIEQLERDVREHQLKSARFSFLASHLIGIDGEYVLTPSELSSLEIIRG